MSGDKIISKGLYLTKKELAEKSGIDGFKAPTEESKS
jgi:hypothetical protein